MMITEKVFTHILVQFNLLAVFMYGDSSCVMARLNIMLYNTSIALLVYKKVIKKPSCPSSK